MFLIYSLSSSLKQTNEFVKQINNFVKQINNFVKQILEEHFNCKNE